MVLLNQSVNLGPVNFFSARGATYSHRGLGDKVRIHEAVIQGRSMKPDRNLVDMADEQTDQA